jgi:dienelactone hydrolase
MSELEALSLPGPKGVALSALLARAQAPREPACGVLFVPGEAGLDAPARELLAALARAGFAALGLAPTARSDRGALAELAAGLAALEACAEAVPERLAVLGLGSGGTLAFLLGCTSTRLGALVLWGGRLVYPELSAERPIQPLELALNLGAPLLALHWEEDLAMPPADLERLRTVLSQSAKDFDIVTVPGTRGEPVAPAAWQRTLAFLGERLG